MKCLAQPQWMLIVIVSIYALAWLIQDQLFLNWDVSYLLNVTQLMLQGGTYVKDYFNPNTPLIMFLYVPPILAMKYLHLNIIFGFCVYIFSLITLVLVMCFALLSKIISQADRVLLYSLIFTLAVVFLIIPMYDFGQREHLLVLFGMPYLLLVALRLSKFSTNEVCLDLTSKKLGIVIGLFAVAAFDIKPQFIFVPILIELYYMLYTRNFLAWIRVEVLTMILFALIYTAIVVLFYSDYLTVVVPFLMRNYYNSLSKSWRELLFDVVSVYCFIPVIFNLFQWKQSHYKLLSAIFLLAFFGYFLSYYTQHTTFYYHTIPMYSMAILIAVLSLTLLLQKGSLSSSDYVCMTLASMAMFVFMYLRFKIVWTIIVFSPVVYFSFFGILYMALTVVQHKRFQWRALGIVSLIIGLGYYCVYMIGRIAWYPHEFMITTIILVLLYSLSMRQSNRGVLGNINITLLAIMFFAYPGYYTFLIYENKLAYKQNVLNKLSIFMRSLAPNRSVAIFSRQATYISPLFYYSHSRFAQSLDCMWPVVGFLKNKSQQKNSVDENYFINLIVGDLHKNKPDIVFIDLVDYKLDQLVPHFSFLTYFSRYQAFKNEWKAYRYLVTIDQPISPSYKLAVYVRLNGA